MQTLKCSEILEATKGKLICGDIGTLVSNVSTDSRNIKTGDLFVPISGERFDGHDFIYPALNAGAVAVITHKDIEPVKDKVIIQVEDTLMALRLLATYYREKFKIPFVGITGSVGKTSTKDMVASVLSVNFNVLKTDGNFNNEIGLPLTIFKLDSSHQSAVLEMGMSGFGEISWLTSIVKPQAAIITNIGMSHIEKLGSRQNILKAKLEILEGLSPDGIVVLNGDDNLLYGVKDLLKFKTVFYGLEEGLDYQGYNLKNSGESGTYFDITLGNAEYTVHVPVPGVHNVYNALAAIAVGRHLNIPMEKIIEGISKYSPSKMRQNIIDHKGIKVINDAYNASPQSMEAALNMLDDISGENRKIAILGDMLEMGEWALDAHIGVGKFAVSKGMDYIITIGELGKAIAKGALEEGADAGKVFSFNSNDEANDYLKTFVRKGDYILVKGSRGMKMEQIVDFVTTIDI